MSEMHEGKSGFMRNGETVQRNQNDVSNQHSLPTTHYHIDKFGIIEKTKKASQPQMMATIWPIKGDLWLSPEIKQISFSFSLL